MLAGRVTQTVLRLFDRITPRSRIEDLPAHQLTGRRGEEEAYFYLRRRGYIMIARNFRTAHHHGEIDLIGWDGEILCFIEVKTRTSRDVKPASAAVDREKRRAIRAVIRDFLYALPEKQFPKPPPWRFDVLAVNFESGFEHPSFELFQNSLLSS